MSITGHYWTLLDFLLSKVEPRTLCPCRLPVHRMAMKHLLWKLAWEGTSRAEKDVHHSTVKSSLSLGVLSPFTSVVAVRMKQRDAWHHGKARNGGDRTGRGKQGWLV